MDEKQLLQQLNLVYVEDNDEMRESVARLLRRRIGKIFLARHGEEGLALVKQHLPGMVITDIEMPVMNGIEMIKKIREELTATIPIIVVTAYEDEVHYTDLANGYVYKPIDVRELFNLMVKLLQDLEDKKPCVPAQNCITH